MKSCTSILLSLALFLGNTLAEQCVCGWQAKGAVCPNGSYRLVASMDGMAPEAKPELVKKKILGAVDKENFIYFF